MNEPSLVKEETTATDQVQAKKPYQEPVLLRWGNLRDLTMTVGRTGAPDWGYGKNKYTGRGGLHVLDAARV
ncbi:MAG: hypothetical protein JSR90_01165 [Proteobacteria bacterium]|nr:hypothetical protein [Pseudomonadota bacterium]